MKRLALASLAILGLAACVTDVTPDERRWKSLEGETVIIVTGFSNMVHANKTCPDLAQAKGEIKVYTVKGGRLTDANGNFFGSERERQPLCPSCVR